MSDKKPEDELSEEIKRAKENGAKILKLGREFTQKGQEIVDLADVTLPITGYVCHTSYFEEVLDSWQTLNLRSKDIINGLFALNENASILSGTTGSIAYGSSDALMNESLFALIAPEYHDQAKKDINNFFSYIGRPEVRQSLTTLFYEFGLEKSVGVKKSPLEMLELAYSAYENPVSDSSPVITSLIPIRECIQMVIDYLLKQRPDQEKARNIRAKVQSIGTQLKRDGISNDDINTWANQLEKLIDQLSEAKQTKLPRDEWERRLSKATIFLDSFLKGLDSSKLREKNE